jgi:hypothetical protein
VAVDAGGVAVCAAVGVGGVAVGVGVILVVLLTSPDVVVFSLTNFCVAASDFSEADVWGREVEPSIAARLTERDVVPLLD